MPTVAEYFAGIGLVRLGLEMEGWRVVFANDISEKKFEMYRGFFPDDPDDHYVVDDIFQLTANDVPPTTLATCSFPCIDLSLAGNMNGIGGRHSSAFGGFRNILRSQGHEAPPLVMVENVPGWLHSNGGEDFRVTVEALNELGYRCDVFALNALRFTPQSRLRVFVVGTRLDVSGDVTGILSRKPSLLPSTLKEQLLANQDLAWFCASIPEPPPLKREGLSEIVEQLPAQDDRWWSVEEVQRHLDMMDETHHERVMRLIESDRIHYRTFFRRRRKGVQRAEVRNDDLSGCLRTAVGGSGKQFLIAVGIGQIRMRAMTPREYARLQGVPDNYNIAVNGVQALTGFGDAVCVPAIAWIAHNVLNGLTPLADRL